MITLSAERFTTQNDKLGGTKPVEIFLFVDISKTRELGVYFNAAFLTFVIGCSACLFSMKKCSFEWVFGLESSSILREHMVSFAALVTTDCTAQSAKLKKVIFR